MLPFLPVNHRGQHGWQMEKVDTRSGILQAVKSQMTRKTIDLLYAYNAVKHLSWKRFLSPICSKLLIVLQLLDTILICCIATTVAIQLWWKLLPLPRPFIQIQMLQYVITLSVLVFGAGVSPCLAGGCRLW